jgi:polysaccharide biosynthesis transport protein
MISYGGSILNNHFDPGSGSQAHEHLWPEAETKGQIPYLEFPGRREWSAIDCLRTLYSRKVTLLCAIGACCLAATLLSLAQPRLYRSEASLEIQGVNEDFLNARDIYPTVASTSDSAGTYIQTQAEALQQDALIEQVVKKLRLEEQPEFEPGLSVWQRLRRPGGSGPASVPNLRNAVEIVKKNLTVVSSRTSRIIQIIYDARNPQLAADVANTLAQTFIEQGIKVKQRAAEQTQMLLSIQLEVLKNDVVRSEAEMAAEDGTNRSARFISHNLLNRKVDADRRFYETMLQRVNDARIAAAVPESNIRFLGPARAAMQPYKPNWPLNLAIGMFAGLILSASWVMLREQNNSFLRTPGEAGMYLTLPELGAIPQAANQSLLGYRPSQSSDASLAIERAGMDQQLSGVSESFRSTLASILSSGRNGDHSPVLVFTSAQAAEGKTTVVSNLGIGLAEIGSKVLMIDGDTRRPRLHKVFDQPNSWGLSDILREKNAIEDVPLDVIVKRTTVPGLYLLPSGACVDNIFALLWSGRMARLLPRFRQEFDYVLVDAPPCLEFADARIMARYADQLLLVVRANYTDRRMAQAAVQRLLLDGNRMMGVILNRWNPTENDMYRYTYYNGIDR